MYYHQVFINIFFQTKSLQVLKNFFDFNGNDAFMKYAEQTWGVLENFNTL